MTEWEFCYQILRMPIWCETLEDVYGDRLKLVKAFRKLIKRAGSDLDELDLIVFAPPAHQMGRYLRFEEEDLVIYLSPCLENESQNIVDYCVAHEFAHAVVAREVGYRDDLCICGKGDDCDCNDCQCDGCRNHEAQITPDDARTAEEYVNIPAEYKADSRVMDWGYRIPAWKTKLRKARPVSEKSEEADPQMLISSPLTIEVSEPVQG